MRGVTRRWFANTVGIVMLILMIFITLLSVTIQNYTYNSIYYILRGRTDELLNVFSYGTAAEFTARTREYIETFPDKNSMEIMVINRNGNVLTTSTGFAPDQNQEMLDFQEAIASEYSIGSWIGRQETNEKVMAITRVVKDTEDNILGSVRYVVSLEKADSQIFQTIITLIIIGITIMLFIILSGVYFIRSIVIPVRQVTNSAKKISGGNFNVRVENKKNDEIGQLCDAINEMASELDMSARMKNDFISTISHELRTPLTSITGWAETLQTEADPKMLENGMQVIRKEAHRLSGIVEELLDFSKLQSGRLQLNYKKADILSELDEVVYLFTNRAASEDKEVIYDESVYLPSVYADVAKLRQVFVNVVDNALKYTDKGGKINISAKSADEWVVIKIADNGCGIPAEHLPNIKKKFYKANQIVRGSGIGLAVADEIIALHAGKLEVESRENVGTTVTVSLPSTEYIHENPDFPIPTGMNTLIKG